MKEMVGGCCVCSDERGWPDNPLVYCDGNSCNVAVHQACYGIVTVPTGPWFCRKCESPDTKGKVRCELCPSKLGALKRSDTGGWAHVVCALYIPEVRFGNVTSMEPIVLRLIPQERYNKTCYICHDSGKFQRANAGACMQCNKSGCKQQFHVTCAQSLGLLCEEAGNYLDNVKYCGYCQHHYSKLKKGGNVKTIPPYKPVSHDSHSSDSSGEKDGGASPMTTGNGTPTHSSKNKGAARKASHSVAGTSGKNTPNRSKTPTNNSQPIEGSRRETSTPQVATTSRKHKSSDKSGKGHHHSSEKNKKPSPSRRGSSTSDVAPGVSFGGSKNNTPAPSPQHTTGTDSSQQSNIKAPGSLTPSGNSKAYPSTSPNSAKSTQEPVGVISSVATATAAAANTLASTPIASTSATTSVVQATNTAKPMPYQESVITNMETIDNKQTKKRKAVANSAASVATDYALPPPPPTINENATMWENTSHIPTDIPMETNEKIVKKAKRDHMENMAANVHFTSPALPPPPPAHSPSVSLNARHLANPKICLPGPSGMSNMSNIRPPPPPQGGKLSGEREVQASLLVSVPLPSTSQGLNLSAHAQHSVATIEGTAAQMFHQAQKQAAMEQSMSHSSLSVPGRATWGGLNVSYEMQQKDKSSTSMLAPKEPMPGASGAIRNKKRAAMAAAAAMAAPTASAIQSASMQSFSNNLRRPPQATPPPIYQEIIKDSPPSSPSSERPLKSKVETRVSSNCTAPHMLGNELNPESGVAARLQEQLSAELAAHAVGSAGPAPLAPPPLLNKATQGLTSGGKGSTSSAQSLDQLLERQWEQGSQFLMEQAQHFDIASLLSCLHQLRTENVRLEEHVGNLLQRRDHLLAVNARLAIPLTNATAGPSEPSRCTRDNGPQLGRGPPGPVRPEPMAAERAHQMMDPAYVQMMMREVQQKPS